MITICFFLICLWHQVDASPEAGSVLKLPADHGFFGGPSPEQDMAKAQPQSDAEIIDQLSAFYTHYDRSKIGKAEIVWRDLQMLFMENAATELEQALMIKYGCNLSKFAKMKSTEVVGTTTNNRWFENTVDGFLPPAYTQ